LKKGASKRKGSGFERTVARLCDKWWNEPDGTFWRTVNSGGWKEPGDIAPRLRQNKDKVWWPCVLECKFVKDVDLLELLEGKKHKLVLDWWKQVTEEQMEAVKQGRDIKECIRLVVFKRNRGDIYVIYSLYELGLLVSSKSISYFDFDNDVLIFTLWNDFVDKFSKKYFLTSYIERIQKNENIKNV